MANANSEAIDFALDYHERTKHRLERYARSLGYLDWDTQPDPFLTFAGAPRIALSIPDGSTPSPALDDLRVEGAVPPRPLDAASLAQLLFDSLAISAWKEFEGSRWALRCNPSSGNLHPTEGYLVVPKVAGLCEAPSLFHYAPRVHALELRRAVPAALLARLLPAFGAPRFLVGLASIHWREAWKYGERAYRYCQHDCGHAIGAIAYAAATLGWRVRALRAPSDAAVAALLALDDSTGVEAEHADVLLEVAPAGGEPPLGFVADERALRELVRLDRLGERQPLSSDHHEWEVIDAAAIACAKPATAAVPASPRPFPAIATAPRPRPVDARTTFRRRRSARDFDGTTGIEAPALFRLLERLLPREGSVPFAALGHAPAIHPILFVHRVAGVEPGVYALPRSAAGKDALRESLRPEFAWSPVAGAPDGLPLFLLQSGDARSAAQTISCHQGIAADGVLALGMLAELEPRLRAAGSWMYRDLHWEAGALGQVLYLEAEALGLRATGIGCFFDDVMHQMLGIRTRRFHTLYHFAIGAEVDDPRLTTLPAYPVPPARA